MKLITDKKDLEGSAYFEFLPREFDGQHWNDASVFVWYQNVSLFDSLLKEYIQDYRPYAYMTIGAQRAHKLAEDLLEYADAVTVTDAMSVTQLGIRYEIHPRDVDWLEDEWDTAQAQLASMLRELGLWLQQNVSEEGTLSVLGL